MLRHRQRRSCFGFLLLSFLASGTPAVAQSPAILPNGTLNAADYSRSFAPGGLISIFGSNLGSSTQQASAYPLPRTLAGASVELVGSGVLLPLWYVSTGQINAQLPFDLAAGSYAIRVRTAAGDSAADTITVTPRAPKFFTIDSSGQGTVIGTTTDFRVLTVGNPTNPGQVIVLWMNSLGVTTGNPTAGEPAPGLTPGSQPDVLDTPVTANINGADAAVVFAGLAPGSVGLYQVNVRAPLVLLTGPVNITVTVGGVSTQANVTLPYRQLGFYAALLGGKAVTGQSLNGVSGATSALAFRQSDTFSWGSEGLNAWSKKTGLESNYSAVVGMALTLRNGTALVYDNNGIETRTSGTFYDNTGGPPDAQKPGLSDLFSMSNYFPMIFSSYFRLSSATQITELIGYFDTLFSADLPFDPANPFVAYRMNIWSNTSSAMPMETNSFTGNVFSSDTTAGTFTFSDTGLRSISSNPQNAPKPIYRISFVLAQPLTLPAGEYWFSHDASVLAKPLSVGPQVVTETEFRQFRQQFESQRTYQPEPARVSLFGQELVVQDSYLLPDAMTVRPSAPIVH